MNGETPLSKWRNYQHFIILIDCKRFVENLTHDTTHDAEFMSRLKILSFIRISNIFQHVLFTKCRVEGGLRDYILLNP